MRGSMESRDALRPHELGKCGRRCRMPALAAISMVIVACFSPVRAQVPPALPGADEAPAAGAEARRRGLQTWVTETSVTTRATLTNNANYGTTDNRQGDLILELIPQIRFNREGGRLRVDGYVALDMIAYVDGTQANRILPNASVLANLEAIDNFFFVDASLTVSQQIENVFLPTSLASSTNNLYTSTTASLAPYMKGNIGQYVTWQVRSDNSYSWTSQSETPLSNAFYQTNLAEVVRAPTPFGWTVRLTNDVTRIQDQIQPDQTLNTALAIFDYAFTPQFRAGLRGGYENTTYTAVETSGPIYGANVTWRPSPLTLLDGFWEERFYGPSYQYQYSHRQRRVATSISGYRTISTDPRVLFQVPTTSSVSGLLNSILIGRFPDPVERAQQVQDLITRQGLPEALPGGAYIFNQSANVLTGASAGVALVGTRNTLGFNLFYLKTENLPDPRVPPSFLAFNNNIQQGGGITLSHRLTPVVALTGTLSTTYTKGFDQNAGLYARENAVVLQANWQATPRTTAFVGARYQVQNDASAALARTEQSEAAAVLGLNHRL